MFRTGFIFVRILAALVLMGLLIAGGYMVFRAGEAQGYALGAAAATGAVTAPQAPVPAYPFYPGGWPGYYGMHFFPFGPLFGLFCFGGVVFFFFAVVGGIFRRRAWHHAHAEGGPEHMHWGRHFHGEAPPEHAKEPPKDPAGPQS